MVESEGAKRWDCSWLNREQPKGARISELYATSRLAWCVDMRSRFLSDSDDSGSRSSGEGHGCNPRNNSCRTATNGREH